MQKNIMLYLNKLEGFKTAIKNLHWDAKGMSEHKFMDDLEDIISDHQDEAAEISQGVFNIKIKKNELQPKSYKISTQEKLIKDIIKNSELFYKTIQNNKKYIGLRSIVEEFLGEMNKQAYLLPMCLAETKLSEKISKTLHENLLKYGQLL